MYSEEVCWTQLRFAKHDVIELATELALDAGQGFIRTRSRHYFEPMEVLVTLLVRMAYPNRWEDRLSLLGARRPWPLRLHRSLLLRTRLHLRQLRALHHRHHPLDRQHAGVGRRHPRCRCARTALHRIHRRHIPPAHTPWTWTAPVLLRLQEAARHQVSERRVCQWAHRRLLWMCGGPPRRRLHAGRIWLPRTHGGACGN
mmetsp:Transcript_29391/g.59181  ORF Transcript_29391/g.59181 Transcript_29391/m.59181 type:complete len:200 (+) Transcript_29391:319-918(+)